MRMWNIPPALLCRQHLLGEHLEMHMFAGAINKGQNLSGYVRKGLVEIHSIKIRHAALVFEMIKRGYRHQSPLPLFKESFTGNINVFGNLIELSRRCKECEKRIVNYK